MKAILNSWLTGWDNLHPEFDFLLNIKRSLFAVWQEYQGLGLLGGMGHASDLPRQLILWLASLMLPTSLLRYFWTFAMFGLGALGCYVLLKKYIKADRVSSLIGGLFYATNFATIQMFYVPFEAFTTHFGLLPWLFYFFLRALDEPRKSLVLWFAFVTLFSTPQAYVPTIFVVYLMALGIVSIIKIIQNKSKDITKRVLGLWGVTLLINAFWLFPFLYFTLTRSHVPVQAKINQMATEEVYLRNRAFGSLPDAIQLKGFWMDTWDFDPQKSQLTPVLGIWRDYAQRPEVKAVGTALFALMLLGLRRAPLWAGVLFLFSVTMLTTDTPPFSWVNTWIRDAFPLFHQVFRFPFTKFSILAGLSYSILLAMGSKMLRFLGVAVLLLGIGIQSYPMFTGNFFYNPIHQNIPKEYFDLFSYLNSKPAGRIANLPQATYWGWSYYRWGYTGSGFLWYGIEQPILDRAFDVWSAENENYYWELSYAIYSKNAEIFEAVLDKYDITYLLLDESLISPSHNRALFISEIQELLTELPDIQRLAQFGNLSVYERINQKSNEFISLTGQLPTVSQAYAWTDNDVAYRELGDYRISAHADFNYPHRSLFSKRSVSERDFSLEPSDLVYESKLDAAQVTQCGLLREGWARGENIGEAVRFTSVNQRGCLSFGIPQLLHNNGYLVAVESEHRTGRPLLISFINQTAKHVELETFLNSGTNYFILPPLASDGLGYTVYLANDSIGRQETINDIKRISFYKIPYQELASQGYSTLPTESFHNFSVYHPNPAYYRIELEKSGGPRTIILNQAYHDGWIALGINDHVLINNWANGWIVPENTTRVFLFFWPQLLEWLGFLLLPIPFLIFLRYGTGPRHPR